MLQIGTILFRFFTLLTGFSKQNNLYMKNLLIILFFIFIPLFALFSQNNIPYFLNGEVGTTSVMNIYIGADRKIGQQTFKILRKQSIKDTIIINYSCITTGMGTIKLYYTVKFFDDTSYIQLANFLSVDRLVKSGSLSLSPEWLPVPAELKENQKLQGYSMIRDYGSRQITTTVNNKQTEGFETIDTDAGTFDCITITYTIESDTGHGIFVSNYKEWHNKDIGLVKQESYTAKGSLENTFLLKSIDIY